MFEDARSKKVILVAHCVLNQNAKVDRCAHHPGVVTEVVRLLMDSGVGLLQLPCPELMCLGLDRGLAQGATPSVEEEDTRIAVRLSQADSMSLCRRMSEDLAYQVGEYRKHGFEIVGLVGINGSPSCGVETTWFDDQQRDGPGVFVEMLQGAMDRRAISVPMRGISVPMGGIEAYRTAGAVRVVEDLLT